MRKNKKLVITKARQIRGDCESLHTPSLQVVSKHNTGLLADFLRKLSIFYLSGPLLCPLFSLSIML